MKKIALVALLLLTGCSTEWSSTMTLEDIDELQKRCVMNNGVHSFNVRSSPSYPAYYAVTCNNGATFEYGRTVGVTTAAVWPME